MYLGQEAEAEAAKAQHSLSRARIKEERSSSKSQIQARANNGKPVPLPDDNAARAHQTAEHPQVHRKQAGERGAHFLRNVKLTTCLARTTQVVENKPEEAGETEEVEDAVEIAVLLLVRLSKRHPQVVGALR